MRQFIIGLTGIALAGSASAQSLKVEPGLWRVSTDIYVHGTLDGAPFEDPPETEVMTECWQTEEEVTLDPGMLGVDRCTIGTASWSPFGLYAPLTCEDQGFVLEGSVEFTVSFDRESFTGRMFLAADGPNFDLKTDGVLMGHRANACPSPK